MCILVIVKEEEETEKREILKNQREGRERGGERRRVRGGYKEVKGGTAS